MESLTQRVRNTDKPVPTSQRSTEAATAFDYLNGGLTLAVLCLFLYILWLGMPIAGVSVIVTGRIVGCLALALFLMTLFGGLFAGLLSGKWLQLGAIVAHYDLAIGRPMRRLLFGNDCTIGRLSTSIIANQAICEGRLLDAEQILLRMNSDKAQASSTDLLQDGLLGHVYARTGRKDQAIAALNRSLHSAEREYGCRNDSLQEEALADTYCDVGYFFASLGQGEKGIDLLHQSLEIRTRLHGPNSVQVAKTLNNLGSALHHTGDLEGAEGSLIRALSILDTTGNSNNYVTGYVLDSLANVLCEAGQAHRAYIMSTRSQKLNAGDEHEKATRMFTLGKCLEALDKKDEAFLHYEKALRRWAEMQGFAHSTVDECTKRRDRLAQEFEIS